MNRTLPLSFSRAMCLAAALAALAGFAGPQSPVYGQFLPGGGVNSPNDTLPPPGVYLSPSDVHAMYTGGALQIVLEAVQHKPFAHDVVKNPDGSETEHSDSTMTGNVSVNGSPFQPAQGNGPMTTQVFNKNDTGVPFPNEMLALNLSGTSPFGPFMIRESPTLASTGQTRITPLSGGGFHIDSFFDVFTELSVDGGQNWIPSNGATRVNLVPEPSSLVLLGLGAFGGLGMALRRRRK